jgi:ABC-type Mn2+/Zn2+ transport system permease subunit
MHWLLEPWQHAFMHAGVLAAALVGVSCATLGVYVVLRRMAFIGDAIAHATLPGLVVAYAAGWNLFGGAFLAGLLTVLGIGWIARRHVLHDDVGIGIMFTSMFALGILLISKTRSYRELTHVLFGNILAVTPADLALMAVVSGFVLTVLLLFHKELELTSADPLYAQLIGLRPDLVRQGLLILLALNVVVAMRAVGVVLTNALLIMPAASAALLTNRLPRMMALATLMAVGAGVVGLYASYYFSVSSGAAIVLTCTGWFMLACGLRALRQRLAESRTEVKDLPEEDI